MNAKKWAATGAAALFMLLLLSWFVWPTGVSRLAGVVGIVAEDPRYASIDQARRAVPGKSGGPFGPFDATPEEQQRWMRERADLERAYREELNKLSLEDQLAYLTSRADEAKEGTEQAEEKFLDSILNLPEPQRTEAVDKFIDQLTQLFSMMPNPQLRSQIEAAREKGRALTKAAQAQSSPTETADSQPIKQAMQILDSSSPANRAKREELERILERRMKERGIEIPRN